MGATANQVKEKLRATKVSGARIIRELREDLAELPALSIQDQIIVLARPRDAELDQLRAFARDATALLDRTSSTLETRISAIQAGASADGQPVGELLAEIEALLETGETPA